jgi:DNA-binding response OmpR family regulator
MFMFGKKTTKKIARRVLLIVEDDALLSRALSDAFSHEQYEILNAANGADVQELVEAKMPDAILLDLILPGLDGFAVLKQLKSELKTAPIPVVVVSNLGSVADVKSVKSLGAAAYFIKANTEIKEIIAFVNNLF